MCARMERPSDLADAMPCPSCTRSLPTRVLADRVTLVVVGACPEHGTAELTRVRFVVSDEVPTRSAAAREPEPAVRASYKPGSCCGRRLDAGRWCTLPVGHDVPHAA